MNAIVKMEIVDLDVWGNTDDGYTVNDVFQTGLFVAVNEDTYTKTEILEQCVDLGYLQSSALDDVENWEMEGEAEFMISFDFDGEPIFQLRNRVEDN